MGLKRRKASQNRRFVRIEGVDFFEFLVAGAIFVQDPKIKSGFETLHRWGLNPKLFIKGAREL